MLVAQFVHWWPAELSPKHLCEACHLRFAAGAPVPARSQSQGACLACAPCCEAPHLEMPCATDGDEVETGLECHVRLSSNAMRLLDLARMPCGGLYSECEVLSHTSQNFDGDKSRDDYHVVFSFVLYPQSRSIMSSE